MRPENVSVCKQRFLSYIHNCKMASNDPQITSTYPISHYNSYELLVNQKHAKVSTASHFAVTYNLSQRCIELSETELFCVTWNVSLTCASITFWAGNPTVTSPLSAQLDYVSLWRNQRPQLPGNRAIVEQNGVKFATRGQYIWGTFGLAAFKIILGHPRDRGVFKKSKNVWPRGSNNQNLKEIRALGSETIATRTDWRRTNFDFMSSADIVKPS